jgi:hypothetical protein
MKKSTRALLLGAIAVSFILAIWPTDSNTNDAQSMITQSCGLEKLNGTWDFATGVNQRIVSEYVETGFSVKGVSLGAVSHERAILAQQAAYLDNKWAPLAELISEVAIFTDWSENGDLSEAGKQFAINGETQAIKAYHLCRALKEYRNS